jgi:hypothetical protein
MIEIRTEIDIAASPERVWAVLTDFAAHPDWNPFIRSIAGVPKQGERLAVRIQSQGGKTMSFRPRVLEADPGRELRWLGRVGLPGIFDGEHFFQMQSLAQDRTRFVHGERFSGVLVPLARKSLEGATKAGFGLMNDALKRRAEATPRA